MVDTETRSSRRRSSFINRKPASNIVRAVSVADAIGLPLNQFVTLNFGHTTCPSGLVSEQFELLRDNHFVPWLRRKATGLRTPPAYVWSIESRGEYPHVHWVVHIPDERIASFRALLPKWLAAVVPTVTCNSAVHVRDVPRPQGLAKYLIKGIDPVYARFFRIRHEPQGIVLGKRAGTSKSLGPSVRRRLQDEGKIQSTPRKFRAFPNPTHTSLRT